MNEKNIRRHLRNKINDWISHVDNKEIAKIISDNAIVTGGAIVSLLNSEEPKDYDIYFKTASACYEVASYYARKWNSDSENKHVDVIKENDRVKCFIKSDGVASDKLEEDTVEYDDIEPYADEKEDKPDKKDKKKYRPKFFSTNAVSLSDKIQLVVRFCGSVKEIHKNYDFVHCTCSYDFMKDEVTLPSEALTAIINKELVYIGSRYPLCSVVRTRKFLARGWHINAGQYVKMALQICKLDLFDLDVFADQLTGVDSYYFETAIEAMRHIQEKNPDFKPDETYLFEIINKIF